MTEKLTMKDLQKRDAEDIARKFNTPICLIILVNQETGDCHGVSWGTDPVNKRNWQKGCDLGGELLDAAVKGMQEHGI